MERRPFKRRKTAFHNTLGISTLCMARKNAPRKTPKPWAMKPKIARIILFYTPKNVTLHTVTVRKQHY